MYIFANNTCIAQQKDAFKLFRFEYKRKSLKGRFDEHTANRMGNKLICMSLLPFPVSNRSRDDSRDFRFFRRFLLSQRLQKLVSCKVPIAYKQLTVANANRDFSSHPGGSYTTDIVANCTSLGK